MSTLVVDGDNLLTIGFYGVKNYFYKGQHIGGIYHFLNTLRRSFEQYRLEKIVVFWDGEENTLSRRKFYPEYKLGVKERFKSEEEKGSYNYQKHRIKKYLEEVYVRQGEYRYCETDDCVAYYIQNSPDEKKIIYSSDGDLTQLINEHTTLYNPSHHKTYSLNDQFIYKHEEVLIQNIKIVKMMCGDPSDNIAGIRSLGIKKFIGLFPEVKTNPLTIEYIKEKTNLLFEEDKHNKLLTNLLTGVTKYGVLGDEFFHVNNKIVSLDEPFLTDEAKEDISGLIEGTMDGEGRSYKNIMRMMQEDGIFNVLPKYDDAWLKFFTPFLRLTQKEKNKSKVIIKKTIKINPDE